MSQDGQYSVNGITHILNSRLHYFERLDKNNFLARQIPRLSSHPTLEVLPLGLGFRWEKGCSAFRGETGNMKYHTKF